LPRVEFLLRSSCNQQAAHKCGGSWTAIIAEIRARQPQARILLFGVFPQYHSDAEPAMENAALAALGNNETVFFIDISKRFFRPDGSFDDGMWATGTQESAFKAWAEELQPWLDRFVG
jgi:hypothetical protein